MTLWAEAKLLEVVVLFSVGGDARLGDRFVKDESVALEAAVLAEHRGGCVVFTRARASFPRCRVVPPPEGEVVFSKVELAEATYDNVPNGVFTPAELAFAESEFRRGPDWSTPGDVRPILRRGIEGAGTMRFVADVSAEGRTVRGRRPEPGRGGPPRDVPRLVRRLDDSYLGFMTELGGLPYIFGSAAFGKGRHQAERGLGVDCADLMVYALRRMGRSVEYVSSRTLGPLSSPVGRSDAKRGGEYLDHDRSIAVGSDGVSPGDWIVFGGHVGAFWADRGRIGVLDDADLILHTSWAEPAIQSLAESGYGDRAFEIRRPLKN